MNDFLELQHLFSMLRKRWWLVLLVTILVGAGGYIFSQRQPKVYEATTTVLVGQSIRSAQLERVDIQTSQALAQTYVDMARREPVLEGVVQTLGLQNDWLDLRKSVSVRLVPDTQLIEISVEANSPEMAEKIADEIANQLLIISPSSTDGSEALTVNDEFNRQQVAILQERITNAQTRLAQIDAALARTTTPEQQAALQAEKTNLENLVVEWGRNYTDLLPLTISAPSRDPNEVTVIEKAHSSFQPVRPNIQLNTVVAAGIGLLLAIALIFLLDLLDDTYKTSEDFAQQEDLKLLGSISHIGGRGYAGKTVTNMVARSALTESYRIIRSRLRFRPLEKSTRTIMVTSPLSGEGKTLTVGNLGAVFAQANLKTIVVDADLRNPSLHEVFEMKNETGLGDLLESSETTLEDALKDTGVANLRILTSGRGLLDPAERLGSERMTEVLDELNKSADVVIFDCPPALIFADAVELSRRMDGVVVVVRAGKSTRDVVNQVLFDLRNARANVLGAIFNDAPRSAFGSAAAYQERSAFRRNGALKSQTPVAAPVAPAAPAEDLEPGLSEN